MNPADTARFVWEITGRSDDDKLLYRFYDNGTVHESGRAWSEGDVASRFRAFVAVRSWEPACG